MKKKQRTIIWALTLVLSIISVISSCTDKNLMNNTPHQSPESNLILNYAQNNNNDAQVNQVIINSQLYLFGNNNHFNTQVKKLTFDTHKDKVNANLMSGLWNIVLLSADDTFKADLDHCTQPQDAADINSSPLYTNQPINNNLPDMPQLRTGYLTKVNIKNSGTVTRTLQLKRNEAKIRIYIKTPKALKPQTNQQVTLKNVPTTLSWSGHLLPSDSQPTTGTMQKTFKINQTPSGTYTGDTLEFIVPAPLENANPTQSINKMQLHVKLIGLNGDSFESADIPLKQNLYANKVLNISIELNAKVSIDMLSPVNWDDDEANPDIDPKTLVLDKTALSMTTLDSLHLTCGSGIIPTVSVPEAYASWLTTKLINPSGTQSYTLNVNAAPQHFIDKGSNPGYLIIKAGKLSKRIKVTQQPNPNAKGSIKTDADKTGLSFHPTNTNTNKSPQTNHNLNITTTGGGWIMYPLSGSGQDQKDTCKVIPTTWAGTPGKAGTFAVNITGRAASNPNKLELVKKAYGDDKIILLNDHTLQTDTITIHNRFMFLPVDASAKYWAKLNGAQDNTQTHKTTTLKNIFCFGGSAHFTVSTQSGSEWILHNNIPPLYTPSTGDLTIDSDVVPNQDRTGTLYITNTDDSNYKISIEMEQTNNIIIPPFDYFVVKFTWPEQSDVDVKCGFRGNGIPEIDDVADDPATTPWDWSNTPSGDEKKLQDAIGHDVGYWPGRDFPVQTINNEMIWRTGLVYQGDSLLIWGGDAQKGQGESVMFSTAVLNKVLTNKGYSKPTVTFRLAATIFSGSQMPLTITLYCYKGGTMTGGLKGYLAFNPSTGSDPNLYNQGGTDIIPADSPDKSYTTKLVKDINDPANHHQASDLSYQHIADVVYNPTTHGATLVKFDPPKPSTVRPQDNSKKKLLYTKQHR